MIRLKCNDCGRTFDVSVGQGRKDNEVDRILTYFDVSDADIIKEKLSVLGEHDSWSYRKMIGYCSTCRSFTEIPTFHFNNNDEEYVTAGRCTCGGICTLIDDADKEKMESLECPECNGTIEVQHLGMWD